jgi:hypothetical protein
MDINELLMVIKDITPSAIEEFNDVRLPCLFNFWGRSLIEELENEDQKTVEITKAYSRGINNSFFRRIADKLPDYSEHTTNGADYKYHDLLIEDKNSFSHKSGHWIGNGFVKCGTYLLKKFEVDETGRIVAAFVALIIDPDSVWTERTLKTNRSVIEFKISDQHKMNIIYGSIKINKKNIKPILYKVS